MLLLIEKRHSDKGSECYINNEKSNNNKFFNDISYVVNSIENKVKNNKYTSPVSMSLLFDFENETACGLDSFVGFMDDVIRIEDEYPSEFILLKTDGFGYAFKGSGCFVIEINKETLCAKTLEEKIDLFVNELELNNTLLNWLVSQCFFCSFKNNMKLLKSINQQMSLLSFMEKIEYNDYTTDGSKYDGNKRYKQYDEHLMYENVRLLLDMGILIIKDDWSYNGSTAWGIPILVATSMLQRKMFCMIYEILQFEKNIEYLKWALDKSGGMGSTHYIMMEDSLRDYVEEFNKDGTKNSLFDNNARFIYKILGFPFETVKELSEIEVTLNITYTDRNGKDNSFVYQQSEMIEIDNKLSATTVNADGSGTKNEDYIFNSIKSITIVNEEGEVLSFKLDETNNE